MLNIIDSKIFKESYVELCFAVSEGAEDKYVSIPLQQLSLPRHTNASISLELSLGILTIKLA